MDGRIVSDEEKKRQFSVSQVTYISSGARFSLSDTTRRSEPSLYLLSPGSERNIIAPGSRCHGDNGRGRRLLVAILVIRLFQLER